MKFGRFWWNLVHRFLNKFSLKWCKCFPSHLSNVASLPCETWNAHCTQATVGDHSRGGINFGVSFCNNSTVARVWRAFQVSQGRVETLLRWGGKRLLHFWKNIQETVYQISPKSPEFCRRYYKKHFGLLFLGHSVHYTIILIVYVKLIEQRMRRRKLVKLVSDFFLSSNLLTDDC